MTAAAVCICRLRRGAALLTVMVLAAVTAAIVFSGFGYLRFAARAADGALGRDLCRIAAESHLELARAAIYSKFCTTIGAAPRVVGVNAVGNRTASAFDWFEAYAGPLAKTSIGRTDGVDFAGENEFLGCRVRTGVWRVDHVPGEQSAEVTLVAEATRESALGVRSRVVLAERLRFAQQRSKVFDNAYFVNNYGWFQGTGCTANGDVRANGDMYLDSGCKINGEVYAARNDELKVDGDVTNYGKMDNRSTYQSTTYGTANRARPLKQDPRDGQSNPMGFDASESVTSQLLRDRVHENLETSTEMPYIGDLSSSGSDYLAWAKELHAADPSTCTIRQGGKTLVSVAYNGVGPSGLATVVDAGGNEVRAPDYGAIVLKGTQANPIEISGPVIIPSDVIISGYVTGQGTIYSGRNIHILGDIRYVNPPQWSGKSAAGAGNADKDLLGLMAKGNIVMGDYTQNGWFSIEEFLTKKPYVQEYLCDTSDASIGYPATFGGSYIAEECVGQADFAKCESAGLASFVPGGYDRATGKFGRFATETIQLETYTEVPVYDRWGRYRGTEKVYDTEERPTVSYDRKYYQSVCDESLIAGNCSTITRIDAVLYNNHGIFGKLGKCSINGALICRNEGLQYSGGLYLNWDVRLYSGSRETIDNDSAGLAKGSDNPAVVVWAMELPSDMTVFAGSEEDK